MSTDNEKWGRLKYLAQKATPGPWWVDSHGHRVSTEDGMQTVFIAADKMGPATRHQETGNLSHWPNDWDASYIVNASPDKILELLEERDTFLEDRISLIEENGHLYGEIADLRHALAKCVQSLDQLLPYLAKVPADVGLLNDALMAARPLLARSAPSLDDVLKATLPDSHPMKSVAPAPAQDERVESYLSALEQFECEGETFLRLYDVRDLIAELKARPAQTEQQPSVAQQILDLIMEECRYWHGRDEARRGGFACLYAEAKAVADRAAPIAQTAPLKPHQLRELVNDLRDVARKYHATEQLREQIAHTLRNALSAGGRDE